LTLLHKLEITGFPGFVEPRLEGTVEAEQHIPALAGDGLDPDFSRMKVCKTKKATEVYGVKTVFIDQK
jgi:hypothetical protein